MHRWLLLLLIPLAGCVSSDDEAIPEAWLEADDPYISEHVDWWEDFSTRWVKRDANLPMNIEVRDYLVSEMQARGFEVETRAYPAAIQGVQTPDQDALVYHAIVATRAGTEMPDHRLGLVSHYDTQTLTFQGAYDDASGVAAQLAICEKLAEREWRRTITCIFFDGEERGLVASDHYVQDVVVEGDEPYVYDVVIGYDMTGINWPGHAWKMYLMSGDDEHQPHLWYFGQDVMHGDLGYPEEGVEVLNVHDRNSDERRFRDVGIPIFRFAGGRDAADYPEYHMPGDTVEYVYDFVGGRDDFEAGFATIVRGSLRLVERLDATSIDEIRADYA